MRPIHLAGLDKRRPVLLLTPVVKVTAVSEVTVAPISTGSKRYSWQLAVGVTEGLEHPSVVKCESITTVPRGLLGEKVGELPGWREDELRAAVIDAFGLLPVFD